MPTVLYFRAKIFQIVRSEPDQIISQARLWSHFGGRYRKALEYQISTMLSEGSLIRLGRGTRGMPTKYMLGPAVPGYKCPVCTQEVDPGKHADLFKNPLTTESKSDTVESESEDI